MQGFKTFLTERYVNIIDTKANSDELKDKWGEQVWNVLQQTYSKIGGIKGSGFASLEDMKKKIPFWKLTVKNDKVISAVFYKDKNGRKRVAAATDGSAEGKAEYAKVAKAEYGRSYGEVSRAALNAVIKSTPWDLLEPLILTPQEIEKVTGDKVIPYKDMPEDQIDNADKITLQKFPQIKPYFYFREIGGHYHGKLATGTTGLSIK